MLDYLRKEIGLLHDSGQLFTNIEQLFLFFREL